LGIVFHLLLQRGILLADVAEETARVAQKLRGEMCVGGHGWKFLVFASTGGPADDAPGPSRDRVPRIERLC